MLDIVLQILMILGIILLILIGIALLVLILVLFFPITYKITGNKTAEAFTAAVKANWLFGLLRARFFYPEPGKLIVKLLWITLYDSSENAEEQQSSSEESTKESTAESTTASTAEVSAENISADTTSAVNASTGVSPNTEAESTSDNDTSSEEAFQEADNDKKGLFHRLTSKYEKIKYTIFKIYDKIKHILDNIAFYMELFKEEQTQGLLKHAVKRLQKIWKNIHPRKLKADIVFGTGAPDTTGYAMGVYGVLSPLFGKHVIIAPDFTEAVFKGEFLAAGHITIFQVILHTVMVLLDKRLKLLIQRIKDHNSQDV